MYTVRIQGGGAPVDLRQPRGTARGRVVRRNIFQGVLKLRLRQQIIVGRILREVRNDVLHLLE